MAVVQDPDVARVFREGLGDRDSLRADDKVRFDMLMGSLIGALSSSLTDQELLGNRDHRHASGHRENIRAFLKAPGGASWWVTYQGRYPLGHRRVIEEILRTAEPPAA